MSNEANHIIDVVLSVTGWQQATARMVDLAGLLWRGGQQHQHQRQQQQQQQHERLGAETTPHGLLPKTKIRLPIKLLKIDCEGCEFDVIPAMGHDLFCDRSQVFAVRGELHVSLLPPPRRGGGGAGAVTTTTIAARPAPDAVRATLDLLRLRGCSVDRWHLRC